MPTKIEWTQETWNPTTGCTKISAGCTHCYAERMARRLAGRYGYPKAPHHFDVTLRPERLGQPLHWKKPCMIFVNSMSDLFHEDVPDEFILRVFDIIAMTPQHTYQILTKRPLSMLDWYERMTQRGYLAVQEPDGRICDNVWLGVSVEKPEYCYRAEYLRQIPAAVRYISFEPLLGSFADYPGVFDDINWCIIGGESGPGARLFKAEWALDIIQQCKSADVLVFMKQLGTRAAKDAGLKSSKGSDPNEWIPELRVREYPTVQPGQKS